MFNFSLLNFSFSLFAFLFAFFVLVGVHEWGHFIAARLCGVKVLRFSFGFGKVLKRWKDKKGTEYVIALIPLGGYVKLLDEREMKITTAERLSTYNYKPIYQRVFISLAGAMSNVVFAVLAFWFVFSCGIVYIKPIIGRVIPNSIAAQAGLHANEEIIAVDGHRTYHWAAVSMALVSHYGEQGQLKITVRESDQARIQQRVVNIDLRHWRLDALRPNPLLSIGIERYQQRAFSGGAWPSALLYKRQYSIFTAGWPAIQDTYYFIAFNLVILYKMLTGVISWQSLGGPVSILEAAVLAAGQGAIIYINFLALLSASVAVINLLPVPGLDGSQIIYLLYEKIRGKPISIATQVLLFRLGMIFLVILLIQVMLNDFLRHL